MRAFHAKHGAWNLQRHFETSYCFNFVLNRQVVILAWDADLGKCPLLRGCPLIEEFFIGSSTVYFVGSDLGEDGGGIFQALVGKD